MTRPAPASTRRIVASSGSVKRTWWNTAWRAEILPSGPTALPRMSASLARVTNVRSSVFIRLCVVSQDSELEREGARGPTRLGVVDQHSLSCVTTAGHEKAALDPHAAGRHNRTGIDARVRHGRIARVKKKAGAHVDLRPTPAGDVGHHQRRGVQAVGGDGTECDLARGDGEIGDLRRGDGE